MLRFNTRLISVVAMITLAGCHTPAPSFNPLIGYGSPRVAPPATGSYGNADSYYPSGAAAAALNNTPHIHSG